MPCFSPLHGFRAVGGGLSFSRQKSTGLGMTVPCGQCIGCRLERSRQWAMRCMHEAAMHSENAFVTLTYSDEHLPSGGSLDIRDFQLFMKRLRKRRSERVRFFHCGEYGELNDRPHYHALLFGVFFDDRYLWAERKGLPVWRSDELEELWPMGQSEIGSVTFESAAYVARYICKKVTGKAADAHYERVDPETGDLIWLRPEYATMSRRPGIGNSWFSRFGSEVYPSDEVIVRGRAVKPPRYYDDILKATLPDVAARVQARRLAERSRADETAERLRVREVCAEARLTLLGGRQ